jgi:hypothetical protein
MRAFPGVAIFTLALGLTAAAQAQQPDWKKVGDALGREGSVQSDGVYKVRFPRSDLHVGVDGVDLKTAFGLAGWVAFEPTGQGEGVMIMGDLVLTESEVNPVMKHLASHGFEITAVHNHLLRASPMPMYMHIGAHGNAATLAAELKTALEATKIPPAAPPSGAAAAPLDMDTAAVDRIMGFKGGGGGGVYGFSIPRAHVVAEEGMEIPNSMGSAIGIAFQPTGSGKAAITGDFVLTADEVNPVLRTLRDNDIEVTALHSHMLNDQPRLFFMHFWAHDDAQKLARGLRAALDKMDVTKS